MLHVSQPILSDTDSDFDDWDPDDTLKVLQVQIQRLSEENRSIKEENKTLCAEKPKQKCCADMQHELSIYEDTITVYASTQDSAFLDELYHHCPESLHKVMETSYFSDLVLKSIPDAPANEIKKLHGVAGDIFQLPTKYFMNTNFERATIPKIQHLLGVTSAMNVTYKTFLPVLFPGLKEDKSLKSVFGNWELLAQILKASLCGVTSLNQDSSSGSAHTNSLKWSVHQVTPGSIAWAAVIVTGIRKKSNISYKNLFFHYKKVLVTKWMTRRIIAIVTNINCYIFSATKVSAVKSVEQEDYTDAIDCALAALDMDSDSDDESNALAQVVAALGAANPVVVPEPTIQNFSPSPDSNVINSEPNFITATTARLAIDVRDLTPLGEAEAQVAEILEGSVSRSGHGCGHGRGRARGKWGAVTDSETRTTQSHR
ncbi:hypothetical protein EV424DRAFT_1542240 [Suillus variegatus]|nr:hypothetical protein EV424DRAFT_1542240 [Suillus variegatus]